MTPNLVAIAALQIGAAIAATLDDARPRELRADQWASVAHGRLTGSGATAKPLGKHVESCDCSPLRNRVANMTRRIHST
jgi:hypothetical protein